MKTRLSLFAALLLILSLAGSSLALDKSRQLNPLAEAQQRTPMVVASMDLLLWDLITTVTGEQK